MFSTMFKSFFKNSKSNIDIKKNIEETTFIEVTRQDVENLLTELVDKDQSDNVDITFMSDDNISEDLELLSITDSLPQYLCDNDSLDNINDSNSEVSSIGVNKQESAKIIEPSKQKIINQINSLQCLFTWSIKSNKNKKIIEYIQNKYGEYNLNISEPEFTFERFVGNIIIGYELFHDNPELGQMKLLEIGKWLEELDNSTDEFYLSIKTGLKHVMSATFCHMLFASNLIEESKWILTDINSFANMDPKSRASVYVVHAAVLIEYYENGRYLKKACEYAKKACEYAKKACDLEPNTSYWFYIYSLTLTAQRKCQSIKSNPSDMEIYAIQQAIGLSDGRNTLYNYHRMTLDKDTINNNYHKNKNDKLMIEKNIQDNKTVVQMIKTIVLMDPKDPHLVIKCARTLMTLPYKVRDFQLGKEYLKKALKMAPNDVSVIKAVSNVANTFNKTSKNYNHSMTQPKQNQPLLKKTKVGEDLSFIVKRYKDGKDAFPYLTDLLNKYDGNDRFKILAQICSYTILFTNNLRIGVEHFITLIEQIENVNSYLITQHFSSFGSKKFNLAELICNEIRLATNSSGTSSENMLFYYKMLTKIMETCNLNMNDIDPSMKDKLIVDIFAKTKCLSTTKQNEIETSYNEGVKNKCTPKNKNVKNMQKTVPKKYTEKPVSNVPSKKNDVSAKNVPPKRLNSVHNKHNVHKVNENTRDQMKCKMSKFLNTTGHEFKLNSVSIPLTTENLRNLQTKSDIDNYAQNLYQNVIGPNSLQFDTDHRYFNRNLYQEQTMPMNSLFQQSLFQNPQPIPSLLSLRPQINPSTGNQKPKKKDLKKK